MVCIRLSIVHNFQSTCTCTDTCSKIFTNLLYLNLHLLQKLSNLLYLYLYLTRKHEQLPSSGKIRDEYRIAKINNQIIIHVIENVKTKNTIVMDSLIQKDSLSTIEMNTRTTNCYIHP